MSPQYLNIPNLLQSSDVLDLLVPILHYLNDARADQARVGLMHIGEHLMMPTTKMTTMMAMTLMIIIMIMMMPVLIRPGGAHALHICEKK